MQWRSAEKHPSACRHCGALAGLACRPIPVTNPESTTSVFPWRPHVANKGGVLDALTCNLQDRRGRRVGVIGHEANPCVPAEMSDRVSAWANEELFAAMAALDDNYTKHSAARATDSWYVDYVSRLTPAELDEMIDPGRRQERVDVDQ